MSDKRNRIFSFGWFKCGRRTSYNNVDMSYLLSCGQVLLLGGYESVYDHADKNICNKNMKHNLTSAISICRSVIRCRRFNIVTEIILTNAE